MKFFFIVALLSLWCTLFPKVNYAQEKSLHQKEVGYYYDINGEPFHYYLDLNYHPEEKIRFYLNERAIKPEDLGKKVLLDLKGKRVTAESYFDGRNVNFNFFFENTQTNVIEQFKGSNKKFYYQLEAHFPESGTVKQIVQEAKLKFPDIYHIVKLIKYEYYLKNNLSLYYNRYGEEITTRENLHYIRVIDSIVNKTIFLSDYNPDFSKHRDFAVHFYGKSSQSGWVNYYRSNQQLNYSVHYKQKSIDSIRTYHLNNELFEVSYKVGNQWHLQDVLDTNGVSLLSAQKADSISIYDSINKRNITKVFEHSELTKVYYLDKNEVVYLYAKDHVKFYFLEKLLNGLEKYRRKNIQLTGEEKEGISLLKCKTKIGGGFSNLEWLVSTNPKIEQHILSFLEEQSNKKLFDAAKVNGEKVDQYTIIPFEFTYKYQRPEVKPTPSSTLHKVAVNTFGFPPFY